MDVEPIQTSFDKQTVMALIGARVASVEEGRVVIELPFRDDLCQQHGYLHAGIVTTIADSAGGYAGRTLMPAGSEVLATGFNMHFVRPAIGDRFMATGQVVKAGRTLTTTRLEVHAVEGETRRLVAHGTQTLMCIPGDDPRAR